MRLLVQFSRFAVGALFVFSGFVKAVDPRGTAIKLDKYYIAWSDQVGDWVLNLSALSLPLSYLIVSFELILGVFLIVNYRKKLTINLLLGVIVFFTMLTFYTAKTGEPSDCGCFGDFMVIEPWTSFYKDIVLLALILVLYKWQDLLGFGFKGVKADITVFLISLLTFGFSLYNIVQLPLIDFRPYAIDSDLKTLTLGVEPDYGYLLSSKLNPSETITIDDEDLTSEVLNKYDYVDQVELKAGVPPKVLEFRIENNEGDNLTKKILKGESALIFARKISKLDQLKFNELGEMCSALKEKGFKVYLVNGFSKETAQKSGFDFNEVDAVFGTIDEDLSKAMIRSNFGLIRLRDGIVKSKSQL